MRPIKEVPKERIGQITAELRNDCEAAKSCTVVDQESLARVRDALIRYGILYRFAQGDIERYPKAEEHWRETITLLTTLRRLLREAARVYREKQQPCARSGQ